MARWSASGSHINVSQQVLYAIARTLPAALLRFYSCDPRELLVAAEQPRATARGPEVAAVRIVRETTGLDVSIDRELTTFIRKGRQRLRSPEG